MSTEAARTLKNEAAAQATAGRTAQAIATYRRALELAPRDPTTWQRLGELLRRVGKPVEAVGAWQRAAGQFALDGQLLKAIAMCRVILQVAPDHEETQKTLAELYARRDEADDRPRTLPASMTPVDVKPVRRPTGAAEAPLDLELTRPAPAPLQIDPATLKKVPLFSDLDPNEFLALVAGLSFRAVRAGEAIVREGDPGASMFCLVEGAADAIRQAPGQPPVVLAKMMEGTFFGEISLLANAPRTATVVATEDAVVLELTREQLAAIGALHPSVTQIVQRHYKSRVLDDLLRASPVFRPFGPVERAALLDAFHARSFPAGTVLLHEGRPGIGLYVILRGRCVAFQRLPDGRENPYPPMSEGDVFGEIPLLLNQPVSASVRTQTDCVLVGLSQKSFQELVAPNPSARALLAALGIERLERTKAYTEANREAFARLTL